MKKRNKIQCRWRMLSAVLAFLMLLPIFAACHSKEEQPQQTTQQEPVTQPPVTEEPLLPIELPESASEYRFSLNGSEVVIDTATGLVKTLATAQGSLSCSGVLVDVGASNQYISNSISYRGYDPLSSQGLPQVLPRAEVKLENTDFSLSANSKMLCIARTVGSITVLYRYAFTADQIALDVQISTTEESVLVNGVAFSVLGMQMSGNVTYEYPGNMPYGTYDLNYRRPNIPNETLFANTVTHFTNGSDHWNFIFNDPVEKWGTGVWRNAEGEANICNLAAVECRLKAGEPIEVGSLYFRFPKSQPYADVQAWYAAMGFAANNNTPLTGPIYCGHPSGTSDTNYILGEDLATYANRLVELRDMGFQTIWTMPLTVHEGHEDLYSPTDFSKLDDRYGGDEQAKIFVDKAHSLGMYVIFDLVHHGLPKTATSKEMEDWVCESRAGTQLLEWNCLAFDFSNPAYQTYIASVMQRFASELGVDGVRIDSAQGSRSNWNRSDGLRPSASTLAGGVGMTQAIKEGFAAGGKNAILLPEMFSPIPNFTGTTDLYYNNALYRVLWDLNVNYISDRTAFTQRLLQFLNVQHQTKVPGQVMANWLQNHDTVCWSGDVKRAEEIYGSEWVRNMFRMISWIDGVPVIYMGDENAAEYGVGSSNLTAFFKETFALREQYLPYDAETEYIPSNQPVFAFYRGDPNGTRYLILLNFSDAEQSFALEDTGTVVFSEHATLSGTNAQLSAYGCLVIEVAGGAA